MNDTVPGHGQWGTRDWGGRRGGLLSRLNDLHNNESICISGVKAQELEVDRRGVGVWACRKIVPRGRAKWTRPAKQSIDVDLILDRNSNLKSIIRELFISHVLCCGLYWSRAVLPLFHSLDELPWHCWLHSPPEINYEGRGQKSGD
jgi:hypothetical protein